VNIDWTLDGFDMKSAVNVVLRYIGFEIGIRKMNPNSIKQCYLGAIANVFVLKDIENMFELATKKKIVKMVMDGYLRIYHKENPLSESRKLAFTLELVKYLPMAMKNLDGIKMKAIDLALKMGICFLLRKSEYLPGSNSNGLSWKDLKWYDGNGMEVSWYKVNQVTVKTVKLVVKFSKTDKYGIGRVVTHTRTDKDYCMVHSLVDWLMICRDKLKVNQDGHIFRHVNGDVIVNDHTVNVAMKNIVNYLGWKSNKVSVHSLRYGGATMLAAAGLPQYIIEYYGGWAEDSKSLKQTYIKLAAKNAIEVSNIFSNGFNVSLEETRIREASLIQ
jgi:hypothetical protein